MADVDTETEEREFTLDAKKLLVMGLVLAGACAALFALYYLQHPERSIFEDWARRPPRVPPSADVAAAEAAERDARNHE